MHRVWVAYTLGTNEYADLVSNKKKPDKLLALCFDMIRVQLLPTETKHHYIWTKFRVANSWTIRA